MMYSTSEQERMGAALMGHRPPQQQSRHIALKSQYLPPISRSLGQNTTSQHQTQYTGKGDQFSQQQIGSFGSRPMSAVGSSQEEPAIMARVNLRRPPSAGASRQSSGLLTGAPQMGHLSQKSSVATSAAFCTDTELVNYSEDDFLTVNRAIELCFSRQPTPGGPRAPSPNPSEQDRSSCGEDSAIVDKLTLIKAYETTLRNQGLNPVQDSRIYKLLFRVVHESEAYLTVNHQYVRSRDMAKSERMSLMQNQLQQLQLKSQSRIGSGPDLGFGARQHIVSYLSQPDIDEAHSAQNITANAFSQTKQDIKMPSGVTRSHPALIQPDPGHPGPQAIDTIAEVRQAAEFASKFDFNQTTEATQGIGTNHVQSLKILEETRSTQYQLQKPPRVASLALNQTGGGLNGLGVPPVEPNPVSDRQIDREIVDLHMMADFYPSFNHENRNSASKVNPDQAQAYGQNLAVDDYTDQAQAYSALRVARNDYHSTGTLQRPQVEETVSSDQFVMTTEGEKRPSFGMQHELLKATGGQHSSMFINTATQQKHCNQASNMYFNPQTEAKEIEHSDQVPTLQPKSLSFCHNEDYGGGVIDESEKTTAANQTVSGTRAVLGAGPAARYQSMRPRPDAQKTLNFKFKVDYSMIFRVFRAWKDYSSLHKRQKKLKTLLLNGLVKAINKHEELLTAKTFRALKLSRKMNSQLRHREQAITKMVARNIKAFYWRLMQKKYKERLFSKNMVGLAASHFMGNLRLRVLVGWRQAARQRRDELQKAVIQLRRAPQAVLVLINFLGFSLMPRQQQSTFDILDFYSYCSIKKRYRPDSKRLARTVELALKQQLRRIMSAWVSRKDRIKTFKKQCMRGIVKRAFQALDKNCAMNYRLRLFDQRRQARMQEQVIIALLQNLEKVRRLALSSQLVRNMHSGFQQRTFFALWRDLHSFYKVGSMLKFSQKSTPLKVLHLQKKRVFNRLCRYARHKRHIKQLVLTQRQKHLVSIVGAAIVAWHKRAVQKRALLLCKAQVVENHSNSLRRLYFKGMVRACMIRQRQRAYREYVLMAKGLQGLAQRVDYRRMQLNLGHICDQTYLTNLTRRAFKAFQLLKTSHDTRHYMLVRARQFLAARSLQAVFIAWREQALQLKQRKVLLTEVDRYHNKKIYRKVFTDLIAYTVRRGHLAALQSDMSRRVELRIYRQTLIAMICKYAKRVNLKQMKTDFIVRKNQVLERTVFYTLLGKFRQLKACEGAVGQRHFFQQKRRIFSDWLDLSRTQACHNAKIGKVVRRSLFRTRAGVFREWVSYTQRRSESRKMKAVSSYFFICKVLRRTILALRMHSIQSKFNAAQAQRGAPRLIRDAFQGLKDHWLLQAKVKTALQVFNARKVQKSLRHWSSHATVSAHWTRMVSAFQARRAQTIKRALFAQLKGNGFSTGVTGPEVADQHYLARLVLAWRRFTLKRADLASKQNHISTLHSQLLKQTLLKEWRQALLQSFALTKIALPYCATIYLKKAFFALTKVTRQAHKARLFARRSYLNKAMRALTLYQMNEVKVKHMQQAIKQRQLSEVFNVFIDQCLIEQDLRLKAEELTQKTEAILCERAYRHWYTLCEERLHLKPIETQIRSAIRDKCLMRLSYNALAHYRKVRQGKRHMYASIIGYQQQASLEKVFRALIAYCDDKKMRREMGKDADMLYRSFIFRRVHNRAQQLLEQRQVDKADKFRSRQLLTIVMRTLTNFILKQQAKKTKISTADAFAGIRLKLNVFRALAIHTLAQERNRVAAVVRRTVCLRIGSRASQDLLTRVRPSACLRPRQLTRSKPIIKVRGVTLIRYKARASVTESKAVTGLLKIMRGGSQTRFARKRKAKKPQKRTLKRRQNRLARFMAFKQSRQSNDPKEEPDAEMAVLELTEMMFDQVEVAGPETVQQADLIYVTKQQSKKREADKSSVPIERYSNQKSDQNSTNKEEQEEAVTLRDRQISAGETPQYQNFTPLEVDPPVAQNESFDEEQQQLEEQGSQRDVYRIEEQPIRDFKRDDLSSRKGSSRYDDNSDYEDYEQVMGIDDCYAELQGSGNPEYYNSTSYPNAGDDHPDEERKHTAQFNNDSSDRATRNRLFLEGGREANAPGMEPIGSHLNRLHAEFYGEDPPVSTITRGEEQSSILQPHSDDAQSLTFIQDEQYAAQYVNGEVNLFTQKLEQADNRSEDEDQQQTMPSFREQRYEGADECERTLSVIYNEREDDLARDTTQILHHHHPQAPEEYAYLASPEVGSGQSRKQRMRESMRSSTVSTAEAPKRLQRHLIGGQSGEETIYNPQTLVSGTTLPKYETNEPRFAPPPRPNLGPKASLRASNREIEDEIALYSSVQNYESKPTVRQFTPTNQQSMARQSGTGKDWLKRTLATRLSQQSNNSGSREEGPIACVSASYQARRSGSWRPSPNPTPLANALSSARLDNSLVTVGASLRSSTQTRIITSAAHSRLALGQLESAGGGLNTSSSQFTSHGKDNRVMQQIEENLSFLNLNNGPSASQSQEKYRY